MGRISFHRRLATRFTLPRLVTDSGTVFVPPLPLALEECFCSAMDDAPYDPGLTAFERLLEARRYRHVLSLAWGREAAPGRTLDLGLLHVDDDKLFVLHQLNDDAGTSLILAYLSASMPIRLFRLFLIDYLSSRGTGYTVSLPDSLPQRIWIVAPEVASHAAVATGLLGLVSAGGLDWNAVQLAADGLMPWATPAPHPASLLA